MNERQFIWISMRLVLRKGKKWKIIEYAAYYKNLTHTVSGRTRLVSLLSFCNLLIDIESFVLRKNRIENEHMYCFLIVCFGPAYERNCVYNYWIYCGEYQSKNYMEFYISNFANANCFSVFMFIFQLPINRTCHNTGKFMNAWLLRIYSFWYVKVFIPNRTFKMTFVYFFGYHNWLTIRTFRLSAESDSITFLVLSPSKAFHIHLDIHLPHSISVYLKWVIIMSHNENLLHKCPLIFWHCFNASSNVRFSFRWTGKSFTEQINRAVRHFVKPCPTDLSIKHWFDENKVAWSGQKNSFWLVHPSL